LAGAFAEHIEPGPVAWCIAPPVVAASAGSARLVDAKGNPMFVSDVNIRPNRTGLPGIASLESIVGALLTFGLVASVAGIAISAIAWAIGSHSGNPHVAGKGKSGVLVALAAAFLIGGATFLVDFFNTQGGHLS
jgi:hypothetical protein